MMRVARDSFWSGSVGLTQICVYASLLHESEEVRLPGGELGRSLGESRWWTTVGRRRTRRRTNLGVVCSASKLLWVELSMVSWARTSPLDLSLISKLVWWTPSR